MDKAQHRAGLGELLSVSHLGTGTIRILEQLQGVSIFTTESNILIICSTLNGGKENPGGQNKDTTVLVEYLNKKIILV